MNDITFEQLPQVVSMLIERVGAAHRQGGKGARYDTATAEKDKTMERLQGALKSSRDILNIIADILYKASEVFRQAIDAIIHFATERHKSIFSPSEAPTSRL